MADWKKEIRKLAKDFLIDMEIYHNAVNEASKTPVPRFYNGNEEKFRYDYAYRKIKPYIMAI